jgi:segregation and condensation protein B
MNDCARVIEALLFLSPEPLDTAELADVAQCREEEVRAALTELGQRFGPGHGGIVLRELAGGYTLASDPLAEDAARRLFGRERRPTLTQAQAETLAIVAYLQPVSRPEIARIRGVSADWAVTALQERDLVEEAGRSQFGATLYRTTQAFLRFFGLRSLDELPDVAAWDPTPEEAGELRERLLRAGEARAGGASADAGTGSSGDLDAEVLAADDHFDPTGSAQAGAWPESDARSAPHDASGPLAGAHAPSPGDRGGGEDGDEAGPRTDGEREEGELQVDPWEHELLMDP